MPRSLHALLSQLTTRQSTPVRSERRGCRCSPLQIVFLLIVSVGSQTLAIAADPVTADESGRSTTNRSTTNRSTTERSTTDRDAFYRDTIQPFLKSYCVECHAAEKPEANVRLDAAQGADAFLADRQLWLRVLRNVRADLMPPVVAEQPEAAQRQELIDWIETSVFDLDPTDPDPGHMAVRRLNRTEYRNTIRDLTGLDFNADVVFPPDDTGFGFDNVGDALSISPLLLEKYVQSASVIVTQAVPTATWQVPKRRIPGSEFRSTSGGPSGDRIRQDKATTVHHRFDAQHPGKYRITVREKLHGSFNFHPGRYDLAFDIDEKELYTARYKWEENKEVRHEFDLDWEPGAHDLRIRLSPLQAGGEAESLEDPSDSDDETYVTYQISEVIIEGPFDAGQREHPDGYARFFPLDEPPDREPERTTYRRDVLRRFATRAFRRPPSESTLDRLAEIARGHSDLDGESFESGIAKAFVAVLASPKFIFKLEGFAPGAAFKDPKSNPFPLIDEYALASRLSYLFWSSMPDDELFDLAARGQLRANLDAQTQRLMRDERATAFARNFVGQWLRARDVEHTSIDPVAALGHQREYDELRQRFQGRFRRGRGSDAPQDPEIAAALRRYREIGALRDKLNSDVRTAMRRETEMAFEYVVENDRSLLELLQADYIFANQALAELYGIDDVTGKEMRRVQLPEGSLRGGVLTQGTMLTVTSNPTRTSPVKRGLFILENLLGTPAPPAPPNVPALEDAADRFGGREPTLRELLAVHREAALCTSCHERMDPLGLALENFNAFGLYRDVDKGERIDVAGELITGEKFGDILELKRILTTSRRRDFYRCVTEKMLVFALGRGLDLQDQWTLDQIVSELDKHDGRFSVLLSGVIDSAPFQKMRRPTPATFSGESSR